MRSDFIPIPVVAALPHGNKIRFLHEDEQIEINAQGTKQVQKILKYCDGHNSIQIIAKKSGLPTEEVAQLIADLVEIEVVADASWMDFDEIKSINERIYYIQKVSEKDWAVKECWVNPLDGDAPFFGATSVYVNGCGMYQYAGATGATRAEAMFKATIEGYERWASGQARVDFHGKAKYLQDHWLDPRKYMPLTATQAAKSGLKEFNEELPIAWTIGQSYDGTIMFVPSDLVYYGQKPSGENRIYWGHSSGIAAYTNFDEAKKRATVELIERDALMRSWYLRIPPKIVSEKILPAYVKEQISYWHKRNRKMLVLEMPSEYGWVFEIIVLSGKYPCFVSGAAATIDWGAIPDAIVKAMEEAEYNLLLAMQHPCDHEIDPKTVMTPMMHGAVYHFSRYARNLSWLWSGETTDKPAERLWYRPGDLETDLKTVTVDLSMPGSDLKVVRVFSPKLVPINFGFHTAHYTHPEIRGKVNPASLKMPHYFA